MMRKWNSFFSSSFCLHCSARPFRFQTVVEMPILSRNANGVRAINGLPASAPTPLALGLNMETAHCWLCDL